MYAVGPPGARCEVGVGTGFVWSIERDGEYVFVYEESWSVSPPKWMGCTYLESARQAYMEELGATAVPSACIRPPDAHVVTIAADAEGLELALVWFGSPADRARDVWLHGYRPVEAPGGELGFRVHCGIAGDAASRCRTSLAFVAATAGGGSRAADAVRASFPDA